MALCFSQISTNAAPSPACATEVSAPTRPAATCAPVHGATSPAPMVPDVWVSLRVHTDSAFTSSLSPVCLPPLCTSSPLAIKKKSSTSGWAGNPPPIPVMLPVSGVLMRQAGLQTCGHHVAANTLAHPFLALTVYTCYNVSAPPTLPKTPPSDH